MSKPIFLDKNKKNIISLSVAELALWVVKASVYVPKITFQPVQDIAYNKTCAKTQISLPTCTVWSVFADRLCPLQPLGYPKRDNQDPCHTGWIYRLIWVFAGHAGLIVGFVVRWLISQFVFQLFAEDVDNPNLKSEAIVRINILDINDNSPKFSQDSYIFPIPERMHDGIDYPVGQVFVSTIFTQNTAKLQWLKPLGLWKIVPDMGSLSN